MANVPEKEKEAKKDAFEILKNALETARAAQEKKRLAKEEEARIAREEEERIAREASEKAEREAQ